MGQDTMLFAYALATTASGLLARGGDPLGHSAGHRFRTGRSRFDFEIRVTASAREGRKEGAKNIRPYCHTC